MQNEESADEYEIDPVYLHARREAVVVLVIFAVFATYVLTVSYWLGFAATDADPPGEIELGPFGGMPRWVFWGIVIPWLAANVVTAWFCFLYMKEDELDAASSAEHHEQPNSRQGDGDRSSGENARE